MTLRAEKQNELLRIQQEIAKLQRELVQLETDLANSRANPALADLITSQERTIARTQANIATLEQRAADVQAQIAAIPDEPPAQSAAADVAASAAGGTQNPAPAPASTGRLTTDEAARLAANTESGTNDPVKTLVVTQSVPPPPPPGANTEARPGGEPGAADKNQDGASAANTAQIINAVSNQQFQPKNNVLDQYASYTYNIGWYLMTPDQYIELVNTKKIALGQYNLLMQSGGAPSSVSGVQPDLTSSGTVASISQSVGRNPFFGLDYYFDDVEITSVVTGSGTNSSHNVAGIKFTVIEPANITLINNLWEAVKAVYRESTIVYSAAYYALVIRFYGYDQNGKIVQASDSDNNNAVVEKIIPFKLNDIHFSVTNKLVEYRVTATADPYLSGFGTVSGVIKTYIELSGATVKDLLTKGAGPAGGSPGSDGRASSSEPGGSPGPAPAPNSGDDGKLKQGPLVQGNPVRIDLTGMANREPGSGF